jgi:hypothetical protein
MNATITLDRQDGGAFQVTAGSDKVSDQRHLTFAVPATNDSLHVGWRPGADFTGGGAVEVELRIGTMPAQCTSIVDGVLLVAEPADAPRFGPDADGILAALSDAFDSLLLAHPQAIAALRPWAAAGGKIGKDFLDGTLVESVAGYAAVGATIGLLLTTDPSGAVVGAAVGAAVGVLVASGE